MTKKIKETLGVALIFGLLAMSCGGGGKAGPDRRAQWGAALQDSIRAMDDSISLANARIERYNAIVDSLMPMYEEFNNPRYVEGFYLHKEHKGGYPLTGTGIVARMSKGEAMELIAVLKGGNFDRIRFWSGGDSISSPIVKHDQQLNYRQGGMTTVAFTAAGVQAMGAFVSAHRGEEIKMEYLNGGKRVSQRVLTEAEKREIGDTYNLVFSHHEVNREGRKIGLYSRKKELFAMRDSLGDA